MITPDIPPGFDFTDPDVMHQPGPAEEFAELRRDRAGLVGRAAPRHRRASRTSGYWAVTRHADVARSPRTARTSPASENSAIIRFATDMTRDADRGPAGDADQPGPAGPHPAAPDLSAGFTPRAIGALQDDLPERAARHRRRRRWPRARATSSRTSPPSCRSRPSPTCSAYRRRTARKLFDWSNQMIGYDDPEYARPSRESAATRSSPTRWRWPRTAAANPRDDIVTKLVNADVDGEQARRRRVRLLRDHAGRRRQRDHPQRDHPRHERLLRPPRPVGAVQGGAPGDRRRRDHPLGHAGHRLPAHRAQRRRAGRRSRSRQGQRVGAVLRQRPTTTRTSSTTPTPFDITRDPNPHLAFGGHGAHYCIGANLARLEIELIFNALADAHARHHPVGEPRRLRHGWINGIKHLPVSYT